MNSKIPFLESEGIIGSEKSDSQKGEFSNIILYCLRSSPYLITVLFILMKFGSLSASDTSTPLFDSSVGIETRDPLDLLIVSLDSDSIESSLSESEVYHGLTTLSYQQRNLLAERALFWNSNPEYIVDSNNNNHGEERLLYTSLYATIHQLIDTYQIKDRGSNLNSSESALLQMYQFIEVRRLVDTFNASHHRYFYNINEKSRDPYSYDPTEDSIGQLGDRLQGSKKDLQERMGFYTSMYLDNSLSNIGSYNTIYYAITQTLASLDNNDFSLVYQEVKKLINDLKDTQRKLEDDFSNVDRLEKISQKKVSASVFCEDLNIPVVSGLLNDVSIIQKNRGEWYNYELDSEFSIVYIFKSSMNESYFVQAFSKKHNTDYFAGVIELDKNYDRLLSVLGYTEEKIKTIYQEIVDGTQLFKIFDGTTLTIHGLNDIQIDALFKIWGSGGLKNLIPDIDQITLLSFREVGIRSLPDEVAMMKNLEKIDLYRNKLQEFPSQLKGLRGLREINASQNTINYIPEWIGSNIGLEKLFLSYNSLLHLPESLVQLENLTDLVVNHNPLQELPGDIGRLKKLQKLILNNTNISSLPESLNDCVVLNTLNIRSCKYLTYFPSLQDIGSFSEIRNDYSGYYISQLNLEGTGLIYEQVKELVHKRWVVINGRNEKQKTLVFSYEKEGTGVGEHDIEDHLGRSGIDKDIIIILSLSDKPYGVPNTIHLGNSLPNVSTQLSNTVVDSLTQGSIEISVFPPLDGLYRESVFSVAGDGDSTAFVQPGIFKKVKLPKTTEETEHTMEVEFLGNRQGQEIQLPLPLGIEVVSFNSSGGELLYNKITDSYRIVGGEGIVVLGLSKNEKKVKKGFKKVYATHIPGKLNDKMRMLGYKNLYEGLNSPEKVDIFAENIKNRLQEVGFYGFDTEISNQLTQYEKTPQLYAKKFLQLNHQKHPGTTLGTCDQSSVVAFIAIAERGIPVRYVSGRPGSNGELSKRGHAWVEYYNGEERIGIDATANKNPPEHMMGEMRKAARKIRSQRKERRLVEERKKQEEYDARIASDLSEKYVLLIEESLKTGIIDFEGFNEDEFRQIEKILYKIHEREVSSMIYTIFFPSGYSAPLSEILIHFDSLRSIDLPDSRSISKRDVYLLNFILQQQSTLEEIFYNWDVSKRPDGLRKIVKKSIIVRGSDY